ncbi:MAG: hypothetical protein Q8R55_07160 [Candidatus Taylorbacteria bacterium]|nr:hypothetical protein [Candidatus Taylorbacteria bacterium]
MVQKSKTVLLAELRNMNFDKEFDEILDELVEEQASKVPEQFRSEFRSFFDDGPLESELSLEFMAGWETNVKLKDAMSVVLKEFTDVMGKLNGHLRALAD